MGQIELWDAADNNIDSVRIEYPGYTEIGLNYQEVEFARSIPMLQDGSTTNLIRYPRVNFWQSTPFYNNSIPMPYYVQGENIQGFEVYQLDDTLGIIQPPVFVSSPNDSTGIISPPATPDRYWYGFLLTGADSAMIYKFVDFYSLASTYAVTVNAPQALHGADVYYDGQYLRPVEQASTYSLPNGAHTLAFKRLGFADTTIYVTGAGTHTLTMQAIDHASLTDSIVHLNVNTTNPRYWKSSTILSNDALFDVSLRQYDHPEAAQWSLEPRSRMFRFRKLNGVSGSLRAAIVLDQPEYLTPDSVYLMQIYNGTQVVKQLPDVPPMHSYDSAFQKLLLDIIPFEGEVSTMDYVFMKRQAPLAIAPALNTAEDTPFAVSLFDLFADPDSIPNDMTFNVTANGLGITTQVIGDSLYFTLDQDWSGTTDVTIEAVHDWLTISQSIPVEVTPVNDAPELTAQQPLTFCHGETVLLDLSTDLSDVDHDMEDITVAADVESATYPSLASDLAIAINGQAVTFSSASEAGGIYQVAIRANDGVDLSIPQTVTVTILPNSAYAFSQTICDGESFEGYANAGVFTDMFTSANGCDSVRTLSLNVLPLAVSNIETAICQGESFEGYTAQGLYTDVFTAINGCDSTRTLNLVVNPLPTSIVEEAICAGESFEGYSEAGTFIDVFQSVQGCDSTRTLNLTLNALPMVNLGADTAICNQSILVLDAGSGFVSYTWNVNSYSQQLTVTTHGYYVVTVTDANGCNGIDGISVDMIALPQAPMMTVMPGSILGSSYPVGNQWYLDGEPIEGETGQQIIPSATGVYTVVHTDQNGCSSESAGVSVMVGMNEITVGGSILVYPNPNSGTFTVRIEGISGQLTLRLMDAIGRLVITEDAQSVAGAISHEFRNIANGVYMVEAVSAEKRWVQRVVVH